MCDPLRNEHCAVCGGKLEYLTTAAHLLCMFCGSAANAHVRCPHGHFVCDECHGKEARAAIEGLVLSAVSSDPVATAELMMAVPGLPMLSCDHAYIAAGALLSALRNSPYGSKIGETEIREVFARTAKQAHGGFCGLTGVCGISPAVGAVFSIFLGARCGSDREQRIVMEAVNRISSAITDLTGPSCCKAYVRAALPVAAEMLSSTFGVVLPVKNAGIVCTHSHLHPHGCREKLCPYYRMPTSDIFDGSKFVPGTTACVT